MEIAVGVVAFAIGLWLGWWRARLEYRSLEEWVFVLQGNVRRARVLLATWAVAADRINADQHARLIKETKDFLARTGNRIADA